MLYEVITPVWQVPAEGLVRDLGGVEIAGQPRDGLGAARVDDAHDLPAAELPCGTYPESRRPKHRAIFHEPPRTGVITSYSIQYTKLYDNLRFWPNTIPYNMLNFFIIIAS